MKPLKYLRRVRDADLPFLANHLREIDKIECELGTGEPNIEITLRRSVEYSDQCFVGVWDDKPVAIFGITQVPYTRNGLIWCLGTDMIENLSLKFLRSCRAVIRQWFDDYPDMQAMYNAAFAKNDVHIRWLVWMKAQVQDPMPWGAHQAPFRPFIIHRKDYV